MNAFLSPFPSPRTRIGFHYYPDTVHYREIDAQTWIPELQAMNASWLVLQSSTRRAIPEHFLKSLNQAGIEPLIQFTVPLDNPPEQAELQPILEAYARLDVHGVILFDRPNDRLVWQSSNWVQQDLVERFLDRYLPLANLLGDTGLTPIFPPLEPGGSYWDTAFLRAALESLIRRGQTNLLETLTLSAYGWTGKHSLNWGAGGPQRWPEAKPYFTPAGAQDQRGFRIFDWYQAICEATLQDSLPIILLGAGASSDPIKEPQSAVLTDSEKSTPLAIAHLIAGEQVFDPLDNNTVLEPVPEQVIACNYWLLAAEPNSPFYPQAWFQEADKPTAPVQQLRSWTYNIKQPITTFSAPKQTTKNATSQTQQKQMEKPSQRSIKHYLLLPTYEWGVADWHLDVIRPFVKKYSPTIGFSIDEAECAEFVTVVGNSQAFPEETLERLKSSGCRVDQICGDGTSIATQLAER